MEIKFSMDTRGFRAEVKKVADKLDVSPDVFAADAERVESVQKWLKITNKKNKNEDDSP